MPFLRRTFAILGWNRGIELLTQPAMRTTEMIVGKGQLELVLQVGTFFGEGVDFTP